MATNLKSFRLDESTDARLPSGINFSTFANQAIKEHLNRMVWIPNFQIEKFAGIPPGILLERVKNVRYLRHSDSALSFTFYPTNNDEFRRNKAIHDYANGRFNALHDGFVYFNVQFPIDFFLFLRSKDWESVEKVIYNSLAIVYWMNEDKRTIMEEQLERKTLREIKGIMDLPEFKIAIQKRQSWAKKLGAKRRGEYDEALIDLLFGLGIGPILFPYFRKELREVHHPMHLANHLIASYDYTNIKLPSGYMRDVYEDKDDWRSIVVLGTNRDDGLHRAESLEVPWKNWIEEYSFYHNDDSHFSKSGVKK